MNVLEQLLVCAGAGAAAVEVIKGIWYATASARGWAKPTWLRWVWRVLAPLAAAVIAVIVYGWPDGLAVGLGGGVLSTSFVTFVQKMWGAQSQLRFQVDRYTEGIHEEREGELDDQDEVG